MAREFGSMETIVYRGVDSLVQRNELSEDLIMVTIIPAVDVRSSTARTLSMILMVAGAVMVAGVLSTMLLTHMVCGRCGAYAVIWRAERRSPFPMERYARTR